MAIFLVSNEVEILKDHVIKLKIKKIAMTVKIKYGWLKSAITSKDKLISATLTTLIKDVEYWKCDKKSHF